MGTGWIVTGAVIGAWGVGVLVTGAIARNPGAFLGLLMLGVGVWLLVRGLNARAKRSKDDATPS